MISASIEFSSGFWRIDSRFVLWLRNGKEKGMTWASMTESVSRMARLAMVAEPEQLST